jgi:glycosyltransferase involved in cell wall biosynthesis
MMCPVADRGDGLVVGIDASNIRAGGGVTHLAQMLAAATLPGIGIGRVIVWGGKATLVRLPNREWLTKTHVSWLERSLPLRTLWQQLRLPYAARRAGCSVLFSPGGRLPVFARMPCVTISQNMLPFEPRERRRFGAFSWMYWKLRLLRWLQVRSFHRATGVIFLTRYARAAIRAQVTVRRDALVPHGIESRFFMAPPRARSPEECTEAEPFRLLYVSIVDVYKHQDRVAEGIARLRTQGLPVVVDFVGPAYGPAFARLQRVMQRLDNAGQFLRYLGPVPFEQLHMVYAQADAFVFASSCENLPNILLEAMAAGLPIACSNRGPMPEVLGDAGIYFDPEQTGQIADAVERLYRDPQLRVRLASDAQRLARGYSWESCARETLSFIASIARAA